MPNPKVARQAFTAVTVGHYAIDVFNSMGPVVVAYLAVPLELSAAQVGLAVGLHQFLAGSTQPFFGWWTDRIGSRIVGPVSVGWAIGMVAAAVVLAERIGYLGFLLVFGAAALGSGAFHPQGTMHASQAIPGRAATTTSVFFFAGQVGLATGPVAAGLALDLVGPQGIAWLALVALAAPVFMVVQMQSVRPEERDRSTTPRRTGRGGVAAISLLTIIFALRAWIFIGTAVFLPLVFQQRGWSSSGQGLVVGCFWLGGGLAGVLAGISADRFGRRVTVSATTFVGALLLPWLVHVEVGGALALALVTGAFLGAPHSVLMVLAQELLPWRRGLSSGLALGFLFAMGALSSWAIGLLADLFGLTQTLSAGVWPGLAVALLALLLPGTKATATLTPAPGGRPAAAVGGESR